MGTRPGGEAADRIELELGPARLILGSAIVILPEIRGSYHAIISDPPYGIAYNPSSPKHSKWQDVDGIVGDDRPFDPAPLLMPVLVMHCLQSSLVQPQTRQRLIASVVRSIL